MKSLKHWQRSVFLNAIIGYMGYYLCRKNLSAAIPLLAELFSLTNTELGQLALFSELAYAAGKFINGPLADKYGGRKLFLLGMLGAIFFNILFALGDNLFWFTIIWCGCRFFLSMGWGGLSKMIGHWFPAEKFGTVMGLVSINFQFGGVLATLLTGALLAMGLGWQELFFIPAVILSIVFLVCILTTREKPTDIEPQTKFPFSKREALVEKTNQASLLGNIKSLLNLRVYRHILVFSFFTTFLRSVFFFWTPKFLVDLGMDTSNAVFKSAVFPLLGAIGTILLGWYTDHFTEDGNRARATWKMLSGLVFSLSIISLVLIFDFNVSYPQLIVYLLGLSGFFLLGPYSMSSGCFSLDISGARAAGSCTGFIDGLGYIGGALAVYIAGVLSDTLSWASVFILLVLLAIISTISCFFLSKHYVINSSPN